ncbi:unnamed protein product [Menidia menidia]|uniref:(Atlantic silverside) hypothetical protein n=1 Tax=Menidia menidia TaxID=238744 RepID=A0A8S4AJE9_9TELE|nr:unnamed protein product [Menidia menidia]
MAASSNAELSPEKTTPLKIPKTEVPSPESEDLSDSNQYHSDPSTPNRFSPLNVGSGTAGRTAASSSSNSFTACRGMSWTPSETNALIAVWGNERLTEARMQQLEVAGTVFSGKAPGPAMYERVSRALAELGYERTPSQCRERMKPARDPVASTVASRQRPRASGSNMAASSNAELSPEKTTPLKIPKTEVPSPESEDLSDSNQYHSDPSTPNRFSPLNVGSGTAGRTAASSSSNSFTACRGMSWTPSETNALIAVWGNERLTEARMQQLEVAGTVFSGKAPGPAMYERVSRALAELGYERTPSQCRERMKTLRRCYSRVKEHGIGKRKSSYTIEQLEKTLRRCYSRVKEHGIGKRKSSYTIEQLEKVFDEIQMPKSRALQIQAELSEQIQIHVLNKQQQKAKQKRRKTENLTEDEPKRTREQSQRGHMCGGV